MFRTTKTKKIKKRTGEKREEHSMMQHDRQIETIKSHDVMKELETGGKLNTVEHNKGKQQSGNKTKHNAWETNKKELNKNNEDQ